MTQLKWDQTGERLYETGTDRGVLYIQDGSGKFGTGVAWNGLTKVSEAPEGAEEKALYADNAKYLSLYSAESFKGTIEAYTYPDEFALADGSAEVNKGVMVGQQTRQPFALVYRTIKGNDVKENDYGYKLHIVYNAKVSPSSRDYETVNDSPAAVTFSWKFTTTPVDLSSLNLKASSTIVIDSTTADKTKLKTLEDMLFGSADTEPTIPDALTVINMLKAKGTAPAAG